MASVSFILSLSPPGSSVFFGPGSSGFTPSSPLSCDSYLTSGTDTNVLQESFAQFLYKDPQNVNGLFFVEPNYDPNSQGLMLQLALMGDNAVVSGTINFFTPSQIAITKQVSCGPGTATRRRICSPAKSLDLNGDSKVNIVDVVLLLDVWGPCAGEDRCAIADLDCNNVVDLFDIVIMLAAWTP